MDKCDVRLRTGLFGQAKCDFINDDFAKLEMLDVQLNQPVEKADDLVVVKTLGRSHVDVPVDQIGLDVLLDEFEKVAERIRGGSNPPAHEYTPLRLLVSITSGTAYLRAS